MAAKSKRRQSVLLCPATKESPTNEENHDPHRFVRGICPGAGCDRTLQCDLTITASKAEGKEPSQQNVGQTTQIVDFIGSGYAVMHTVSGINPWNMNQVPVTMGDSLYVLHTARSDANGTTTDITLTVGPDATFSKCTARGAATHRTPRGRKLQADYHHAEAVTTRPLTQSNELLVMSLAPNGGRSKMKFSLVNGRRQEAQPNLSGECPVCGQATVAKCGEVKIWHCP